MADQDVSLGGAPFVLPDASFSSSHFDGSADALIAIGSLPFLFVRTMYELATRSRFSP